jgi:hypothetical protein
MGGATGPYYIEFQLVDGDLNYNQNTVTVDAFDFGGGQADGAPDLTGGASGDLTVGVSLVDSAFFNAFFQPFTPGTLLKFNVNATLNSGAPPDQLSFAILNNILVEVPTSGPGNELFNIDLTAPGAVNLFAGLDAGTGDPVLSAPVNVSAIPEPATVLITAGGLALTLLRKRNLRK